MSFVRDQKLLNSIGLTDAEDRKLPFLAQSTHFAIDEMRLVARLFKLHSPDHTLQTSLNLIGFRKAFSMFNIPANLIEPIFRAFDKDGNHVVDFKEFVSSASVFLKGTFEEKLQMFFSIWDTDHSDELSADEIRRMLLCVKEGCSSTEVDVDYMMSKMDANRDGNISFAEFTRGVYRLPQMNLLFRKCFGEIPMTV